MFSLTENTFDFLHKGYYSACIHSRTMLYLVSPHERKRRARRPHRGSQASPHLRNRAAVDHSLQCAVHAVSHGRSDLRDIVLFFDQRIRGRLHAFASNCKGMNYREAVGLASSLAWIAS